MNRALPSLPLRDADDAQWSANVIQARQLLGDTYRVASNLLEQPDVDPLRFDHHLNAIIHNSIPIIVQLTESADVEGLSLDWTLEVAECFTALIEALCDERESATSR